jgi:hypothetical protein
MKFKKVPAIEAPFLFSTVRLEKKKTSTFINVT